MAKLKGLDTVRRRVSPSVAGSNPVLANPVATPDSYRARIDCRPALRPFLRCALQSDSVLQPEGRKISMSVEISLAVLEVEYTTIFGQ